MADATHEAKRLDLNLLAIVVALFDEAGVSHAAFKLGMSQPAVSGALARLRAYFNDPLFVRTAGRMQPTPRGEQVVASAREILRRCDEELAATVVFDPLTTRRPFTFAMSDVGEMVFLPKLLKRLARDAPNASVRSVSLRPLELAEALAAGEVDLAVGYFPDLKQAGFFQQRLLVHHFVCLLRAGHPIKGRELTLPQFLGLQHAVVQSEGRSQEIVERFMKARGLTRRIALVTPHFLGIARLIAQSDMVVTVPHALGVVYGTAANGLKTVAPPFESPKIELKQHWHRKVHKDARSLWLRGVMHELHNDHTDEW
jgi:DNA-binding transcriptional LysR family regulator